ncbi:MAG: agmatine deiminase family protein [Nitrospirae bacterium]|nr:agmatine deiminase family protein [Nitrospirota bacterium]
MKETTSGKTPARLGYVMPAEWERHEAIWLSWPHDPVTFPDRVEKVEKTYVELIRAVAPGETVRLLVTDAAMRQRAERMLQEGGVETGRVSFHVRDYADVWFRDYGPIFVVNRKDGTLAITHWVYNAWGGKYPSLMKDTKIPVWIGEELKIPSFSPGIVLEGGSIDVNGRGTLLTTEQCLLNKNRNPQMSRTEIETCLKEYLGVTRLIWLKNGIEGDDTDGHIDDIARFVDPATVLCVYEEDKNDENYPILHENYEILRRSADQDGNLLKVVKLPTPGVVGDREGRLPASYANFYIGNETVVVPVFGHPNDPRKRESRISKKSGCPLPRK